MSELPSAKYKWSIPSISPFKQTVLCTGYIHENNTTKKSIPHVIYQLMAAYFTPNDQYTLNDIQNAEVGATFSSKLIEINNLKWVLAMWPNGRTNDQKDEFVIGLKCYSYLGEYQSVRARISLMIEQLYPMIPFVGNACFDAQHECAYNKRKRSFKNFKKLDIDQITITLGFQLLDIIDKNGKNISEKFKNNYKTTAAITYNNNKIIKIKHNKKMNELKYWLTNIVELGEYFNIFVQNGIEDLYTIKLVNENVLNEIGIKKIGHKLKILNFIKKLQLNDLNIKQTIGIKRSYIDFINKTDENSDNQPLAKKQRQ